MKGFLHHLFIPRESNNHRAKLLHNSVLFFFVIFLFLGSFILSGLRSGFPSILGVSSHISTEQLLVLTNKVRQQYGLSPLTMNTELMSAAEQKAGHMFLENYWAHNAPDGKTPWVFIKEAGYEYVYAGENLARGFEDPEDVIDAWMASPTHRANVLSKNYKDVGFSVKKGRLDGEETVLIVEELGNRTETFAQHVGNQVVSGSFTQATLSPMINSVTLSSGFGKSFILLFIFALLLDMIIIERKKIVRFVGHNLDHLFYLGTFFLLVGLLTKGAII